MRLDKFLKVSRLIKRRTVANEACDAGRVLVNGKVAKASMNVKEGDIIDIQFGTKTVKVRVISINEAGKINLSVKQAQPAPPAPPRRPPVREARSQAPAPRTAPPAADPPSADKAFEDRLKKFMQESDSRIADNRMYSERRQRSRRK